MPTVNGQKALDGERTYIEGERFEIHEDMLITFEGQSCNILDKEGTEVFAFRSQDGLKKEKVLSGYKCYVLEGWVQFRKN
jgi:hypothetical protein